MKYFAFSDVHGDYDALMQAVKEYGYDPENENHTLVSCGDNFGRADRGEGSKGVYTYLTQGKHKNMPVCLKGNHELILQKMLFSRELSTLDIRNGEHRTVYSFLGRKQAEMDYISYYDLNRLAHSPLMDWLLDLPYCFETDHYIFLHGFLPQYPNGSYITKNLESADEEAWQTACWAQTPLHILKFPQSYPAGLQAKDGTPKWVVFGHWMNRELRRVLERAQDVDDSLWKNERLHLCGLDTCTYASHRVEMLVVED